MDRDSTLSPGFRVDPDELATVASHLHDTAEDAIARARHEYTTAADDPAVIQRRRGNRRVGEALVAAPRLPKWLPDLDAAWQHQRADLIMATRTAAAGLVGTAASYRNVDDRLGAGLSDLNPRGEGRAALGRPRSTAPRSTPPRRLAMAPWRWTRRRRRPPGVPPGMTGRASSSRSRSGRSAADPPTTPSTP